MELEHNACGELFADAVLVHLNARTRYLEAIEAIEEARWALAEILADMAVCADRLGKPAVPQSSSLSDTSGMAETLIGERRARTVKTRAERLRDRAGAALAAATSAMDEATDAYCARLCGLDDEAPRLNGLQRQTDAANAAVADLDGDADEIDRALAAIDSLLVDRAQVRAAGGRGGAWSAG